MDGDLHRPVLERTDVLAHQLQPSREFFRRLAPRPALQPATPAKQSEITISENKTLESRQKLGFQRRRAAFGGLFE